MKVNTQELERQSRKLRDQAYRLDDIEDTVRRIRRVLRQETIGEEFSEPLRAAVLEIDQRSQELRQLRIALQEISRLYEDSEQQILLEADAAAVHNQHTAYAILPVHPFLPWIFDPLPDFYLEDFIEDLFDRILDYLTGGD